MRMFIANRILDYEIKTAVVSDSKYNNIYKTS
jgi:hypothetical protein